MEDETIESRAEFWRRRDCRSASAGRDIQRRRRGNHEVMMTGGVPDWLVERCLRDASGVLESYVVRRLKEGAVPRASEIEIEGRRFVWKSYPSTGWRGYFAGLFRRDAAMRAWCNAKALSLREIPTPRAVLLARRRRMGVPVESHLLTELVDAEPLLNYVHRIRQQLAPPERRRATRGVVLAAARLLRLMHDRRVTHHDLKASNVLATAPRDLAHPELWLVDLDSAQTWLRPPERERIQNIGRLAASFHGQDCLTRADYLRFVRTYLGGNAFRQGRWKPLWRRVRVWVERKVSPRKPAAWADRSDSRSARD